MHVVSAAELQRRIGDARDAAPGGAIACDGDGTIWAGDVGEDLFVALVARGELRPAAVMRMRIEAQLQGLDDRGSASELARRIFDAYLAHAFPEERVCELMAWAFAEWTKGEMTAFARGVIEGLEGRLHREVVDMIAWARAAGIDVLLVSASPRAVVEEAARRIGVPASHVLAATPRYAGEVMLSEVELPIPYGPGKVRAIRGAIGARPLYAAFGDNAFDVAMLRESRVPVAVRPKERLRQRAEEVHGLVEIARSG
jgi:phosphatidylglycerophosphatase C